MSSTELLTPATTACAHCRLEVPTGFLRPDRTEQFCCSGCETVWGVLHDAGLEGYYRLGERRSLAVHASGRDFEEFDHPAFHALYVRTRNDGLLETELYLEGVHCSACVWLVERVPLTVAGVARAELEIGRSLAHLIWDPAETGLSEIARFLDRLGYRPHPFRGVKADALRRGEDRAMLQRIGVAGALAANVMLLALALYSGLFAGMEPEFERYFRWLSLVLVTPALFWPGRIFFQGAFTALRSRILHMDLPIAIGLGAGYLRGLWNTVTASGPIYFDGVATLVFLLLVGRFLQLRAQRAAADSAELLHSLGPSSARVVEEGTVREIPTEALVPGMVIEVWPGETMAADGILIGGHAEIDAALLSGESRPLAVKAGGEVWAGTLNLSAPIRVRVAETGESSRLGRILREVESAASRRAPVVALANRMAGAFVAVVLLLAVGTVAYWWQTDPSDAIDHAIALLVVTCPCALALATPLAFSVAIGRAASAGILIKGGDALEFLGRGTGTIYFDKTGTLTTGKTALRSWDGPDAMRGLVLALERDATHPVAAGFRAAWPDLAVPVAEEVRQVIGGGVTGTVDGRTVVVGSPVFVGARAAGNPNLGDLPRAQSPVLVAVNGEVVARAGFGDPIRPESADVLGGLRARGWKLRLLSGDAPDVVGEVGETLGFGQGEIRGGATPEEKLATLAGAGAGTVMVGDGVNDAAAMARASVGIGIRGGAEACLAVADVFLSRPGLQPLADLMTGAERTLQVVRRNIAFALGYNLIGAGLAMAGLLDPLVAAVLMPLSSLTVVLHSWRARSFEAGTG
ncbi:MAG: heavy metal translocating P-type ATPase [Gemmatimonadota bacterium]|nr:heavy metal translocating P-type ATPase [Gemmatimonadota bacterium]